MTSCSPQRPMRWNAAIGAIARCKRVSTGCGRKRRSVRVWRSICGVKPTPKAVNKPSPHCIVHELDKPGSSATVSKLALITRDILAMGVAYDGGMKVLDDGFDLRLDLVGYPACGGAFRAGFALGSALLGLGTLCL